jgi:hypothetical protein
MGSLAPTHLIALLAVAAVAAASGFIASTVIRKRRRRARGYLVVGFCCGLLAGAMLRKWRGLNVVGAIMQRGGSRPLRAVIPGIHFATRTATFAASRLRLGARPQW